MGTSVIDLVCIPIRPIPLSLYNQTPWKVQLSRCNMNQNWYLEEGCVCVWVSEKRRIIHSDDGEKRNWKHAPSLKECGCGEYLFSFPFFISSWDLWLDITPLCITQSVPWAWAKRFLFFTFFSFLRNHIFFRINS